MALVEPKLTTETPANPVPVILTRVPRTVLPFLGGSFVARVRVSVRPRVVKTLSGTKSLSLRSKRLPFSRFPRFLSTDWLRSPSAGGRAKFDEPSVHEKPQA